MRKLRRVVTGHNEQGKVVLAGKVRMLLDEGEVGLEPFDVVVQRGTNHAWVNRGTEPTLLLAVMIDVEPL